VVLQEFILKQIVVNNLLRLVKEFLRLS